MNTQWRNLRNTAERKNTQQREIENEVPEQQIV